MLSFLFSLCFVYLFIFVVDVSAENEVWSFLFHHLAGITLQEPLDF
jgi:hypothetical protein